MENKAILEHVEEVEFMVSQNVASSWKHLGGYLLYVFTEQGIAILSTVLNNEKAVQVNIAIMQAFVKLKKILSMNKELAYKLAELEHKTEKHDGRYLGGIQSHSQAHGSSACKAEVADRF